MQLMFLFLSSILEKGPQESSPSTKSRISGDDKMRLLDEHHLSQEGKERMDGYFCIFKYFSSLVLNSIIRLSGLS